MGILSQEELTTESQRAQRRKHRKKTIKERDADGPYFLLYLFFSVFFSLCSL
jgi:hypothetical protein